MVIDYEITERDYVHGSVQVFMPPAERSEALKMLGFPLVALLLIALAIRDFLRSGLGTDEVVLVLLGVGVLFAVPLFKAVLGTGVRKHARTIYRNTSWLRERLLLDVNEEGAHFTLGGQSMKTGWAEFTGFFEDRRTFILYQRNPQSPPPIVFHIVPKHNLSRDQMEALRRYLQSKIGKQKAPPQTTPISRTTPPHSWGNARSQ